MSLLKFNRILQTKYNFVQSNDSGAIIVFLIILTVFIIVAYIAYRLSKSNKSSTKTKQRYSKYNFNKMALNMGLQKYHIRILQRFIGLSGARNPLMIFSSPNLLDKVLREEIHAVNSSKEEKDNTRYMNAIFEIKEIMERHAKKGIGLRSSYLIKPNQTMKIISETGDRFQAYVISNLKSALNCGFVNLPAINRIKWKKGVRLKVIFWRENDSGYSFISKLIDFDIRKQIPSFSILHSIKMKREQQRKYSRKPIQRSCFFYPADVVSVGKKNKMRQKLVIQKDIRFLGNITNIFAGGCSIVVSKPFKKGKYLEVDFDIKKGLRISSIGRVIQVKRDHGVNICMHVAFKKLSDKSKNQIYSYIFNYIQY